MAGSDTVVANMALRSIGVGKLISDLTTETGPEARACRTFYDVARDEVLRDFGWPFATKFVDLGLVEEEPTSEWQYSYRVPSDCLMARRILSGNRNDSNETKVPYRLGHDEAGPVIYTDKENAELEYTLKAESVQFYPPDFVLALAYKLGYLIAPSLTAGDPAGMLNKVYALYTTQLAKAKANARNEEQRDQLPQASWVTARDGVGDDFNSPWRALPPVIS